MPEDISDNVGEVAFDSMFNSTYTNLVTSTPPEPTLQIHLSMRKTLTTAILTR